MADRFPLILNTSINQIQEIASGDNLDLTGSGISNAGIITASSFSGPIIAGAGTSNIVAGIITATQIDLNGDIDVDGHTNLDNVSVAGVSTFAGAIDLNADLDVDGHTNLDNVSIAGVTTIATNTTIGGNLTVNGTNTILNTTTYVKGGQGADGILAIYADEGDDNADKWRLRTGTNSAFYIDNYANGAWQANLAATATSTQLYSAGYIKLNTTTNGINVYNGESGGTTTINVTKGSGDAEVVCQRTGGSGIKLRGSHPVSFLETTTDSDLRIRRNTDTRITLGSSGNTIAGDTTFSGNIDANGDLDVDGHTNLDNVSVAGVTTFSGGISGSTANFSGNVTVGGVLTYEDVTNVDSVGIVTARLGVFIPDDDTLKFGNTSASPDLTIEHVSSGSGFNRLHASNGYMQYRASAHFFNDEGSSINFIRLENNKVDLRFNGASKLTTETSGVNITGVCTATSFSGPLKAGDTEVECVDSGSGGEVTIKADNTDVMKIIKGSTNFGKIGINQFNNRHSPVTIAHTSTAAADVNLSLTAPPSSISVGGGTAIFMKSSNDLASQKRYGTLIQSIRSSNDNGSPEFVISKENAGATGLQEQLRIDKVGQVLPGADNTQNLGSSTKRWANIYSADIHCSNKGSSNDVDGTWGDFTIQEGESDLFLINNRSGKKYKFNLMEVN